jgi:hypothetical protein
MVVQVHGLNLQGLKAIYFNVIIIVTFIRSSSGHVPTMYPTNIEEKLTIQIDDIQSWKEQQFPIEEFRTCKELTTPECISEACRQNKHFSFLKIIYFF